RPPRSRMPWAARESDGTTTTKTSELLSVGKEQLSGATATPSTGSQDSRTETRIDGPMGRASYQPTAQRVPTLGAASQPTPSLQLQVLVHDRPRRSLGGHVEHQDPRPAHVPHRLLPGAQQLLGRRLA